MKKLICLLFVLSFVSICFAINKNVIYNKDTKEIQGIAVNTIQTKDPKRVNIYCENDTIIYGANTDKVTTIAVDEKNIPVDILEKEYKVDINTKEIYQEVKLGD